MPEDSLQKLAYELSFGALGQQERTLEGLRARTGTLIAASAVIASFLGGRAIDSHGIGWLGGFALAAFIGSVSAGGWILRPENNLVFALRGSALLEAEFDHPVGLAAAYRRLAYWIEEFRDANQRRIDGLIRLFRLGLVAVAAEAILWAIQVAQS